MWSLLILHVLHACNTTLTLGTLPSKVVLWGKVWMTGTGPVQTTISLSLLYLFFFTPRNEWHQNVLNSQILSRVTRSKIKMGTPT